LALRLANRLDAGRYVEELSKDGTATVCANRTMKPPDSRRLRSIAGRLPGRGDVRPTTGDQAT
jgi:hypothetical protein